EEGMELIPHLMLWHLAALVAAAVFLGALFHDESFRKRCRQALYVVCQGLRLLFWEWPLRFLPLATISRIINTWVFQLIYWYLIKPGMVTALFCLLAPGLLQHPMWIIPIFAASAFLLNSRMGRATSEAVSDALVNLGRMVQVGLIPAMIHFSLYWF